MFFKGKVFSLYKLFTHYDIFYFMSWYIISLLWDIYNFSNIHYVSQSTTLVELAKLILHIKFCSLAYLLMLESSCVLNLSRKTHLRHPFMFGETSSTTLVLLLIIQYFLSMQSFLVMLIKIVFLIWWFAFSTRVCWPNLINTSVMHCYFGQARAQFFFLFRRSTCIVLHFFLSFFPFFQTSILPLSNFLHS